MSLFQSIWDCLDGKDKEQSDRRRATKNPSAPASARPTESDYLRPNNHFDLLGLPATDKVTGFKGVITSLSFDLYGCVTVVIDPGVKEDNSKENGRWFDVTRLKIESLEPIMERPDFETAYAVEEEKQQEKSELISSGKKGAAEKPLPFNP